MAEVLLIPNDGTKELLDASKAEPLTDSEVTTGWFGFKCYLTHEEVHLIATGVKEISSIVPDKRVQLVVKIVATVLEAKCLLGGHNGVTVMGPWPGPHLVIPGKR